MSLWRGYGTPDWCEEVGASIVAADSSLLILRMEGHGWVEARCN